MINILRIHIWIILFLTIVSGARAKNSDSSLVIWYSQTAERWLESMPLGNGRLGAMIYGGISEEMIALNETTEQPLQFGITLKGDEGKIIAPELEFNRSYLFKLPGELEAGYTIVSDGSAQLIIYDSKGRFIKNFNMGEIPPVLRKGKQVIRFNCHFHGANNNEVNVVFKQTGSKEEITLEM